MNVISQAPHATEAPAAPKVITYDARDLLRDGSQASIVLDGQVYFLRITRAGKLILTK